MNDNDLVTMFAQKDFICDRYKYDPKGACAHDAAGGPKKIEAIRKAWSPDFTPR